MSDQPDNVVVPRACPYSGHTASTDNATQESGVRVVTFKSPAGGEACRVECCCGVQGPSRREYGQAIAAWNTRSPISQAPAAGGGEVERIARLADEIRYQVECSAANLKRGRADAHLVDICLGHFTALADRLSSKVGE